MLKVTIRNLPTCVGLFAALLLSLSACDGTTFGHFDIDEPLPETRVEGSAAIALLPALFPPVSLDVTSSEQFESEEYDYVTSIQLDELTLSITDNSTDEMQDTLEDGNPDNFNFLSSLEIYIQSDFEGQTRRELIGIVDQADPQLSTGLQSISVTMTGIDILSFVEADGGYEVQIEASGEAPPDAVLFDGSVRYRVGVGFR